MSKLQVKAKQGSADAKDSSAGWFTLEDARGKADHKFIFDVTDATMHNISAWESIAFDKQATRAPPVMSEWDATECDMQWMPIASHPLQGEELKNVTRNLKATVAVMLVATGAYSLKPTSHAAAWWLYVITIANLAKDPMEGLLLGRDIIERADVVQAGSINQMKVEKLRFAASSLWQETVKLLAKIAVVRWDSTESALRIIVNELYRSMTARQLQQVIDTILTTFAKEEKGWDAALLLAAYTLRLIPLQAEIVCKHYNRKSTELEQWGMYSRFHFPPMTRSGLELIKIGLQEYGYALFWPVGESYLSWGYKPRLIHHWNAIKKWFGSRWEWFGLPLTSALLSDIEKLHGKRVFDDLGTADIHLDVVRNMLTSLLYANYFPNGLESTAQKMCEEVNFEIQLNERDCCYARFCKIVSATYFPWASFHNDGRITSLIMGIYAFYSKDDEPTPPANVDPLYYHTGRFYAREKYLSDFLFPGDGNLFLRSFKELCVEGDNKVLTASPSMIWGNRPSVVRSSAEMTALLKETEEDHLASQRYKDAMRKAVALLQEKGRS
ncbi:unnamed protein product [Cylicocyclus nassatus]|uniref:Uncharacterized protein n=1 Tax=Cylicocyclus nassatus TaxID=53992 RepID=A0AA36GEH3_CYLNA|nr:unnamed protein product [Cylicocyclus nassatus]